MVKNLPANTGDKRDTVLIPGSGRFPGVGNGNPFQYSCLENSMDRGAWQAAVHGITKSWTCARTRAHTHTHTHTIIIYTLQDSSVAHSSGWSDGRRRYRFFPADKLKLIDGERTGWSLGTVILDGIGLSVGPLGGTGFQRAFRKNTGMRFS